MSMNYISVDEFKKLDLRVGRIIEVKDHPNASKLYILTVDLGYEKRQIVSGIKEWYKPEDLIGKSIIVITNLEPKNIRGIESQGMLLAAEDENGNLSLIVPEREVKVGAKVY